MIILFYYYYSAVQVHGGHSSVKKIKALKAVKAIAAMLMFWGLLFSSTYIRIKPDRTWLSSEKQEGFDFISIKDLSRKSFLICFIFHKETTLLPG